MERGYKYLMIIMVFAVLRTGIDLVKSPELVIPTILILGSAYVGFRLGRNSQ